MYCLVSAVDIFLGIAYLAMLLRAILSWFPLEEGNRFEAFLILLTEPLIIPVRVILSRFRFVEECPIDLSFGAAFFLLMILESLLPAVTY